MRVYFEEHVGVPAVGATFASEQPLTHTEEVEFVVTLHAKDRVALLDDLQADSTLFPFFFAEDWTHVETLDPGMRSKLQKATFVTAIFTAKGK